MAVTAKFKVGKITPMGGDLEAVLNGDGYAAEVELTPDYAQGKNEEWSKATPSGVIRLTISNVAALRQFVKDGEFPFGKAFTVTFTEDE